MFEAAAAAMTQITDQFLVNSVIYLNSVDDGGTNELDGTFKHISDFIKYIASEYVEFHDFPVSAPPVNACSCVLHNTIISSRTNRI